MFAYVTPPNGYCPACQRATESQTALQEHNLGCSHDGERSYTLAVNVAARTVQAKRIVQGSGVWAKGR